MFFELTNEEIELFKKIGQVKSYDEDAILFYENEKANNLYIILSGFVKG
ncbi:MAG: Crp/Fnr family transcriptional regulator, partial [Erysipelotrichia bacterium]|nr:Crp/Fnr family transcriptional regulator [Erysipelotrichia bacterium]